MTAKFASPAPGSSPVFTIPNDCYSPFDVFFPASTPYPFILPTSAGSAFRLLTLRAEARILLQSLNGESLTRVNLAHNPVPPFLEQIAGFRITGLLGRGGTSTVYAAERTINGITQPVALKLLHSYLTGAAVIERFQREQAMLVRLDHPSIWRMLDAGLSSSGQPDLVLERIDGLPIDEYANSHRLTVPDRIRLILSACDAIAGVHRSFIAHLDLKPGNLFITPSGHVCLLDFGTAKLVDPVHPLTSTRHLTPLYAAPEQPRGEAVSTACDVYSHGMVLYELLAGANPFSGTSLSAFDERDARDLTVNGLRFLLDGDIERVVACALARDPHDRYPSITEFAEDLRRYLENRPVLARRQTAAYRLRKYVSRNRTLLALSAVLLLFAAIAVLFGWQERERAIAQGRRAQASSAVLLWHISSSNPI